MTGASSNLNKERTFQGLLTDAQGNEAKYLIRFIEKNFKINCGERLIQKGLGRAFSIYHEHHDIVVV